MSRRSLQRFCQQAIVRRQRCRWNLMPRGATKQHGFPECLGACQDGQVAIPQPEHVEEASQLKSRRSQSGGV